MRSKNAAGAVWRASPRWSHAARRPSRTLLSNMSPRVLLAVVAIACVSQAVARPVRRTLNFNMFVLKQKQDSPDRVLLSTDGVSRFGPILEYLVQRVQGLMSVRLPQGYQGPLHADRPVLSSAEKVPLADAAENEVEGVESRMPGVIVRPSRTKPGMYEVEIDVVVDDGSGQPEDKKPE